MSAHETLGVDVAELLRRRTADGMLLDRRNGEEDLLATAMVIPTFAERGRTEEAVRAAEALARRRDHTGGWDDPWTTVIALEAFIGLKLRGVPFEDIDGVIDRAVEVLRGTVPLPSRERELRLSRALVLAGLSKQEATLVDAGLLRARGVLDGNEQGWREDLGEALHGLLALVDLHAVTRDEATAALIRERFDAFGFIGSRRWSELQPVDSIARAGIVLAKMNHENEARAAYDLCLGAAAETLDTISLKHRVELGARLYGGEKAGDSQGAGEEAPKPFPARETVQPPEVRPEANPAPPDEGEEPGKPAITARPDLGQDDDPPAPSSLLPALKPRSGEEPTVSVVLIQRGGEEGVHRTLKALRAQVRLPDEVILVHGGSEDVNPADSAAGMLLREVRPSRFDSEGTRWALGASAATCQWVWFLVSGVSPRPGTLGAALEKTGDGAQAIYLAGAEGQLQKALESLPGEPSLPSHHVLFHSSLLSGSPWDAGMRAEPFWLFALQHLAGAKWAVATSGSESGFEESVSVPLEMLEARVRDRIHLGRRVPAHSAELHHERKQAVELDRETAYEAFRRHREPLVSIIIPHYNLPDMLRQTLERVIENTEEIPFEIIVVDNGSDNTGEELRKKMEEWGVLCLRNERNEGFARACNRGVKAAKADYIVLLNNDTEVEKGWLRAMLQASQEEEADIVGALMLYPDRTIQHAGITFSTDFVPGHIYGKGPLTLPPVHKRRAFQAVTAACMLVRKSLYERLGGLDEGFINSFEDVDFCLRARRLGARIVYEPKAVIVHHAESTPGRKAHDKENMQRYLARWRGHVEPDTHLYAKMDGYQTMWVDGKEKLVPIGRSTVTSASGKEDQMKVATHKPGTVIPADRGTDTAVMDQPLGELLAKADTLIRDGRFDEAEQALIEGRQRVNGNVRHRARYWTLLGDARFRLDRAEEAFRCYQKAVLDDPSSERAWIGIATYHLVKGELDTADELFKKVLSLSPENARGHLGRGNVLLRRGDPREALDHFLKSLQYDPGNRSAVVGMVAAAVQGDRMDQALRPLEAYLELHPEDSEARFHYAAILFGAQETDRALEEAEKVLDVQPQHRGARELINQLSGSVGQRS